jgi:hypothetical protein
MEHLARQAIRISATNFGPNDVVISGVVGLSKRYKWVRFKTQHFVMFATSVWPLIDQRRPNDFGNLPTRIPVGDSASWYLPIENRYFTESDMTHFGLADTFGRTHWAKHKHVNSVREGVMKYIQKKGTDSGSKL